MLSLRRLQFARLRLLTGVLGIALLAGSPTATAQVGFGLTASVSYFDVNLVSGLGPAVGATVDLALGAGRLYGAARLDIGFAELSPSDDYVFGEPGMFGSACTERATGERVAEVFCLGLGGFDSSFGALNLEAGYVPLLPVFVALGGGVRSGEEIDRMEGKTVKTRPYATALVRYPFTGRLSGYAQAHLGPGYAQGHLGLVF